MTEEEVNEISAMDIEIRSIGEIIDALKPLDADAANRALDYGRQWQVDRMMEAKKRRENQSRDSV